MKETKDIILTLIYLTYIVIYGYKSWKFFLYNLDMKDKYGNKFFILGRVQNKFLTDYEKTKYRKLGRGWFFFMIFGFLALGIISFIFHYL